MPPSSGNLVDLPPQRGERRVHLVAFRVGEASAQSDLGDSEPVAGDEGLLCR